MEAIMARPTSSQPTEVELAILQVLWEHGGPTLGQIHELISQTREVAYSSTRKMVQVMCEKQLVEVDDSVRPQLYRAGLSKEQTQLDMLDEMALKVFGGSVKSLVMSLVSGNRLSGDELQEIQRLTRKAERKKS